MKKIKKIISIYFVFTSILISISMCFSVSAASPSASISVSSSTLDVGSTVVITANYSANSIGCIQANLTYDTSVLQFVSGENANGGAGIITISTFANKETSSMKFPLTFKAIKAGVSSITLTTEEFFSLDNENLGQPSSGTKISVKDVSHNLSSNANLKSLSFSAGSLSPSFKSSVTSYTLTVPYETTSVTISAAPEDSSAKVTVSNMKNLSVGSNKQTIGVVAADGTQKNYTVNVVRSAKSGSDSTTAKNSTTSTNADTTTETTAVPEEQYPIEISGKKYKIQNDLTGIESPGSCFTLTNCKINDTDVAVYKHNNADITLVYLVGSENKGAFFIYHSDSGTYTQFVPIKFGDNYYVVIDQPSDTSFDKYTKTSLSIGDYTVDAWNIPLNGETSDFNLIYAVNQNGESQWYQYDIKEKTLQRYFENTNLAVNSTPKVDTGKITVYKIVVVILSIVTIALIILLLYIWQKNKENGRHINRW